MWEVGEDAVWVERTACGGFGLSSLELLCMPLLIELDPPFPSKILVIHIRKYSSKLCFRVNNLFLCRTNTLCASGDSLCQSRFPLPV